MAKRELLKEKTGCFKKLRNFSYRYISWDIEYK